jgi:hypothetical protein
MQRGSRTSVLPCSFFSHPISSFSHIFTVHVCVPLVPLALSRCFQIRPVSSRRAGAISYFITPKSGLLPNRRQRHRGRRFGSRWPRPHSRGRPSSGLRPWGRPRSSGSLGRSRDWLLVPAVVLDSRLRPRWGQADIRACWGTIPSKSGFLRGRPSGCGILSGVCESLPELHCTLVPLPYTALSELCCRPTPSFNVGLWARPLAQAADGT